MSSEHGPGEEIRRELARLKVEFEKLKTVAQQAETDLELEFFTLVEELQLQVHELEQKIELYVETHEDRWDEFRDDLERSWEALRNLIRSVTGP